MIRLLLLSIIAFLSSLTAFAKTAPGYFITLNYDTVHVAFSISQYNRRSAPSIDITNGGRALYFDENNKLQYLSPEDVLEISATYKGYQMRKLARLHPNKSVFNTLTQYNRGYIFFDVSLDGLVKILSYIEQHPGGSHQQILLQIENEPLIQIEWSQFKDQMASLFEDHASLRNKIEQELYTKEHLAQIVKEYNTYHANSPQLRARKNSESGF